MEFVEFVQCAGVAVVLVLLLVAVRRGWLVWGWEMQAERERADEWRGLARDFLEVTNQQRIAPAPACAYCGEQWIWTNDHRCPSCGAKMRLRRA